MEIIGIIEFYFWNVFLFILRNFFRLDIVRVFKKKIEN